MQWQLDGTACVVAVAPINLLYREAQPSASQGASYESDRFRGLLRGQKEQRKVNAGSG